MTYTKEEILKLKENLRLIENWITENIVNHLNDTETVEVSLKVARNHSQVIRVTGDGTITYSLGNLVLYFTRPYCPPDKDRLVYSNPYRMEDLFLCWKKIKADLLDSVFNAEQKRNKILNFEV